MTETIFVPLGKTLDDVGRETQMRYAYRNLRYDATERERDFKNWRSENSWMHCRPYSVLVAAMGYHWAPESYQRLCDAVDTANREGCYVAVEEIMDRCFNPYDALGAMRNEAVVRAKQGYEYLCYVDNDILPEPDTLVRLLSWMHRYPPCSIVAPFVQEPDGGRPLHGPHRERNTGLQPVRWTVLSMLLFRTSVFNAFGGGGGEFWNNAIGADEGYHFQKLWDVGIGVWLDTNTYLPVHNKPTYPLATNRMQELEAKSFWDKRREWLNEMPDRRPINPLDPRQTPEGEYIPGQIALLGGGQ